MTKSKKIIPLLRRASLSGLRRQKSFDLGEEEVSCQIENSRKDFDKDRSLSKEFILSSISNHNRNTSPNSKVDSENRKNIRNHKSIEKQTSLNLESKMNDEKSKMIRK